MTARYQGRTVARAVRAPPPSDSQFLAQARRAQVSNDKQFNDMYVDRLLSMNMMEVPPRAVTNKRPSNYYVVVQSGQSKLALPAGETAIVIFNPCNQVAAFSPAPITTGKWASNTAISGLGTPTIDTTASYYPSDLSSVFGYAQLDTDGTSDYCPLKGRLVIDCVSSTSVSTMPVITACGLADLELQCGYTGAPATFTNGNWYAATVGSTVVPNLSGNTPLLSTDVQNHGSSLVPAKNAKAAVLYFQPVLDNTQGDTFRTGNTQTDWANLAALGEYPNHLGYGTSSTSCVQPHVVVTNPPGSGDLIIHIATTVAYAVPASPQQSRSFPLYVHSERSEFRKDLSSLLRSSLSGVGSVAFESSKSIQDAVLSSLISERKSAAPHVTRAAQRHGQAEGKLHHETTAQRVRATESGGKPTPPNPAIDSSALKTLADTLASLSSAFKEHAPDIIGRFAQVAPVLAGSAALSGRRSIQGAPGTR